MNLDERLFDYYQLGIKAEETGNDSDFIAKLEQQWPLLDDSKFEYPNGSYVINEVINAYGRRGDVANIERWLKEEYKHRFLKNEPIYAQNYYKGVTYFELGLKEKALEYFLLSYAENKTFIFEKRVPCCVFFNYYLEHGKIPTDEYIESETNKILGISEDDDDLLELKEWNAFFSESSPLYYDIIKKDGDFGERLTKQHNLALDYLMDNQKRLLEIILDGIFAYYSKEKPLYQVQGIDMPKVDSVQDLASLLMLTHFNFISVYNQGVPYIGFSFHCQWEIEHGLGVLMHKDRIVQIGYAEVSFDVELAKEDLKKSAKKKVIPITLIR